MSDCADYDEDKCGPCPEYGGTEEAGCYKPINRKKADGSKVPLQRHVISPERIKEQLDKLLNKVNAVTCPYRHGQKVTDRVLTELSNRQLDVEEALREMGL